MGHSSVLCVGTKGYRSEELKLLPGCRCSTATIKVLLSLAHNVDQLTEVAKGESAEGREEEGKKGGTFKDIHTGEVFAPTSTLCAHKM